MTERGLNDAQVATALMLASLIAVPLALFTGKLLDAIGRRGGAVLIYSALIGSGLVAYNAHGFVTLTVALTGAIFAASGTYPVLNALTLELFPTHLRADGFAWANAFFGKLAYVIGPVAVGVAAAHSSYSFALSCVSAFPLIALALILARVPETSGRELESTSAL